MGYSVGMKGLRLVLSILEQPEVSRREMGRRARQYLASLSDEEYKQLKEEAVEGGGYEEWLERIEVLRSLGFTSVEAGAYGKCRLSSPGIRRVIARRALLGKMLEVPLESLAERPPDELARMEDVIVGSLDTEDMVRRLKRG